MGKHETAFKIRYKKMGREARQKKAGVHSHLGRNTLGTL